MSYGDSLILTEATAYGTVYFLDNMCLHAGHSLEGKTIGISGSGNVTLFAMEKTLMLGADVITLSDSSGFVHYPRGINNGCLACH